MLRFLSAKTFYVSNKNTTEMHKNIIISTFKSKPDHKNEVKKNCDVVGYQFVCKHFERVRRNLIR